MTPSMETMAPRLIFRMCPLFRQRRSRNSEGRTDRTSTRGSARVSGLCGCFRKDGQQETAWIADLERAALPLRVARLRLERDAGILRPLRYLVDAARRRDRQAHADSLLAVAPLLPIVLVQADLA